MKVLKLSFIMDLFFYLVAIFLLSFVWVRYFVHNFKFIILICFVISMLSTIVIVKIKTYKNKKNKISTLELEKAKNFSLEMMYLTPKEQCLKFCKILGLKNYTIKKNFIIYEQFAIKPMYKNFSCKKEDLYLNFALIKNEKINKIIFCATNFEDDAKSFKNLYNSISIKLVDQNLLYACLLKTVNYESQLIKEEKLTKKQHIKYLLSIAFNSKRAKNYFIYAILLFLFSFLYRYNIYYIIACSISFIFALFSKFNKIYNKTTINSNFFD